MGVLWASLKRSKHAVNEDHFLLQLHIGENCIDSDTVLNTDNTLLQAEPEDQEIYI